MTTNTLLDAIREAFTAATTPAAAAESAVKEFCVFGNTWLQEHGVVGVGQTVAGFSLRLADGTEHLLTTSPSLDEPGNAVSISGIAGRGDRTPVSSANVQITGR
jgi:hypothetical protein